MLQISPFVANNLANLFSLECWGGKKCLVLIAFIGEIRSVRSYFVKGMLTDEDNRAPTVLSVHLKFGWGPVEMTILYHY